MKSILISVILLSFLMACGSPAGKQETKKTERTTVIAPPTEENQDDGQLLAVLKPINLSVVGKVTGALTLSKDKDEFVADVRFNGGPYTASIIHSQNIHIGKRCPVETDDINMDGYIDGIEGEEVFGKILIPLDGDLSSQLMGNGIFPVADEFGSYIYSQFTSFSKFMADLHDGMVLPNGPFAKLDSLDEPKLWELVGKVIVIKGIAASALIPSTVVSNNRYANYQTLPIACGVITKVKTPPGSRHRDETDIPVPGNGQSTGGSSGNGDDGATLPIPREINEEAKPEPEAEIGAEL